MKPLVMTEEFWLNSMFSIARFYGGINIQGKKYIVDDNSNDLVLKDFYPTYKKLGRHETIRLIRDGKSREEIEEYAKSIQPTPKPAKVKKIEPPKLNFDEQ